MKTKITKTLLCILIGLAAIGPPTEGRAQHTRLEINRALMEFDRRFRVDSQLIMAFSNTNAVSLLQQAKQLRDQAFGELQSNQLDAAWTDILQALKLLEDAVRAAIEAPLQRVRSLIEERMRRAESEVIGAGHPLAERLLQEAKKTQAHAEAALRMRRYLFAKEQFEMALKQVNRALEIVHGHRLNPGSADDERKQFETLAARAREAVEASPNASAKPIYEQAMKQARTAEAALRNSNAAMALQLYYGATRLLLRAIDLAGPNPASSTNRLESELALLQDLINSAEKQIDSGGDSRAAMLVGRARALADEARRALERKNEQEAEWRLTLARSFVSKAMRAEALGPKVFESRLEDELAGLGDDLKELDQRAREQGNDDAMELVALARLAAGRAERASALGRPRVALQALLAAQRFLANAETMLSKGSSQQTDRNEVSQKLESLDALLQEVSQGASASRNEVAQDLLRQVTEIRDGAREAYGRGRLRVANESADVAMEMLRTVVKINSSGDKP